MKTVLVTVATLVTLASAPLALANEDPPPSEGEVLTLEEGASRMGMTSEEFIQHSKTIDTIDRLQRVVGQNGGLVRIDINKDKKGVSVLWRRGHDRPKGLTDSTGGDVSVAIREVSMSDAVQSWLQGNRQDVWVDGVTSVDWDADLQGLVVTVVASTPASGMSDRDLVEALKLPAPVARRVTTVSDGGFTFNSRWTDAGAHNP